MSGFDIIRRNVEFDNPERVGLRFPSLGVSDILRLYVQLPRRFRTDSAQVRMDRKPRPALGGFDEWGCRWDSAPTAGHSNMGQVTYHPLREWAMLSTYPFPDPSDPSLFDGLEEALAGADGRYVQLNSPFCLFERMHFLRGLEALLTDLYLHPAQVHALADRVIEYQLGVVQQAQRLGRGRIHCFDTTDDWGSQTQLFIRPEMWREFFRPRYKRLFDAVHAAGMHVRFHTDGKVNAILEDLVELGVDIINIHQPRLLGIEEVGAQLAGRVCFEASVDVQATLPGGDRQAIEREVHDLVAHWASPRGGLIGVEYREVDAINAPREILQWELEAFRRYGTWHD